jgi:hypothetical protein
MGLEGHADSSSASRFALVRLGVSEPKDDPRVAADDSPSSQDGKESPAAESPAQCHWLSSAGGGKDDRRIGMLRHHIGNKLFCFFFLSFLPVGISTTE